MIGKMPPVARAWLVLLAGCLLFFPRPGFSLLATDLDPQVSLNQFSIDTWDGSDGLPQIRIRAIVQTRDGYLWLGTANGLVRFDGANFTTFGISTSSLKDNEITSLVETRDGALWVGTYGGGLTRMKDGQFTTFTPADGLPDNSIRKMDLDAGGNLWVATPRGLSRYDHGAFVTYTTKDGLPNNFIVAICAGAGQGVFAAAGGRLNHLVNGRFVVETNAVEDSDGRMDSMTSGADGALWMTFESSVIKRWKDGKVTSFTKADHGNRRPGAIYEDPRGSLWIGTRDGLLRYRDGNFSGLTNAEAQAKLGVIQSMFADREGNLWLGTEANGLARLRSVAVRMLTTEDGLPENSTRCVYRDQRGDFWVGTYLGFARISHGKLTAFTQMEGEPLPTVTSIGEDARGRIWIAAGGRLLTMDNDRLIPLAGWTNVFDIKVIARDGQGALWAGTDGEGLFRFANGQMTGFRTKDGLANNQVRAILSARDGALWVGTTAGLSRFQDGAFTNLGTSAGLVNNRVMALCEDTNGVLWIGTRGGLSRYQDGKFFNFGEAQGLPNNFIFNVLDDGGGNFWLSSGGGICRVRQADLNALAAGRLQKIQATSLGYRDGLRAASLVAGTQPNACATGAGQLLFCSLKGVVVVNPDSQEVNRLAPPVRIEQVVINKQERPVNHPCTLPRGSGEVEIHYTALSYVAPEKVRFKYRLEGMDRDWVDAGQRRFVHYASLPPGSYRFHVIACNNDGLWNTSGASYAFRLPPRFYQTAWFPALLGVAFAALAAGVYVWKIHRLRVNERNLQRRVDEAVAQVKVLRGLLPICGNCKKIRDDKGYWNQIESYMVRHTDIKFSHSLCPDCLRQIYPEFADEVIKELKEGENGRPI